MDIYSYLRKDHRKVSSLFKQIIAEENPEIREELFLQLKLELELHADPENETFYKALSKNKEGKEEAHHGEHEHDEIKRALYKLSKISPTDTAEWFVHLGELKRMVEHHVEEEEHEMFELGKKVISDKQAIELVAQMEDLKEKKANSKIFMNKFAKLQQENEHHAN